MSMQVFANLHLLAILLTGDAAAVYILRSCSSCRLERLSDSDERLLKDSRCERCVYSSRGRLIQVYDELVDVFSQSLMFVWV